MILNYDCVFSGVILSKHLGKRLAFQAPCYKVICSNMHRCSSGGLPRCLMLRCFFLTRLGAPWQGPQRVLLWLLEDLTRGKRCSRQCLISLPIRLETTETGGPEDKTETNEKKERESEEEAAMSILPR